MQGNNGYKDILEVLNATTAKLKRIQDDNYNDHCLLVSAVEQGRVTVETEIRSIMDGFLNHFEEERFLELYERLCKACYGKHPELVEEHIKLFQLQIDWMDSAAQKHRFPITKSDTRSVPELTGEKYELITMALTRRQHMDDPWMLKKLDEIEAELDRRRNENSADKR